jgi:actinin alpha
MDEIMAIVDPDQTGYVTYEAFVDFLGRNKQDSTSSSQFLQNLRTLAGDKVLYILARTFARRLPRLSVCTQQNARVAY